jgi:hypothetical protein
MKTGQDPVGELVLLCKAAAEAGQDWRGRLRCEWVPRWLTGVSRTVLGQALHGWTGEEAPAGDLGSALESAVVAAMGENGYD